MLGFGKGNPLSRFKEGAQDAKKGLRHPSKGTIGFHSEQKNSLMFKS